MPIEMSAPLLRTIGTSSDGSNSRFGRSQGRSAPRRFSLGNLTLQRSGGSDAASRRPAVSTDDEAAQAPATASAAQRSEHNSALRRLMYVGPLTPAAGVADFFETIAAWADERPYISVEVVWFGDGDLKGILQAQPLPPNMYQVFKSPAVEVMPRDFASYDLCVMPRDGQPFKEWSASVTSCYGGQFETSSWTEFFLTIMEQVTVWICDPARRDELWQLLDTTFVRNAIAT